METLDEFDFNELNDMDIEEFVIFLDPYKLKKDSTKFIITTLIAQDNIDKLIKLNKNLKIETFYKYYNNLRKANYFSKDKIKINLNDEKVISEILLARYVAEGVFKGKYKVGKYYEFIFKDK